MDVGDSLNVLENALRDLIERVLRNVHGDSWFDHLGVTEARVQLWAARLEEEPKRRPGGEVEQRRLYYAEFFDVREIIRKNWDSGFKDCFGDLTRFNVYMERLEAFRNPDAHSRALMPFEEHLILGMTGQLRQEIAVFLSTGAGGPEPEYFPHIEEVRDSYGNRAVGMALGVTGSSFVNPQVVLRPGDAVSFTARAWDPEGGPLKWEIYLRARDEIVYLDGSDVSFEWQVGERDIAESSTVGFYVYSARTYHRKKDGDDTAMLDYRVLPAIH